MVPNGSFAGYQFLPALIRVQFLHFLEAGILQYVANGAVTIPFIRGSQRSKPPGPNQPKQPLTLLAN